ncbi:unnamed protein product [Alopecurus aequalis]
MDPSVDSLEARWCAVTGGRGFMAKHLVLALLRSGGWRVRITDLAPEAALEASEHGGLLGAALRDGRAVYVSADVCQLAQLTQAFQGVDTVFHAAAPDHTNNDFQLHYKVNVEGTRNVIQACRACKFPDAYTQTKAEAEKLVMRANDTRELLTCCIRPGSIFGPGDKLVATLLSYGATMFIIGDGKNWDDFVYVENVVHGHLCAEKTLSTEEGAKRSGGKAYFITNMEPVNMWNFMYTVLEHLGYKSRFRFRIPSFILMVITYLIDWSYNNIFSLYGLRKPGMLSSANIKYATLNRTFNCNNAVEELGYKPIVSLQDGVRMTSEFYKKSRLSDMQIISRVKTDTEFHQYKHVDT